MAEPNQIQKLLDQILRLRRSIRGAPAALRTELTVVLDFLEDMLGPTIRPADAARALGVSRPAMKRWLDLGEIASVTTPSGRREVPVSELIGILEELNAGQGEPGKRALADLIRERQRQSKQSVDIDRLLPSKRGRTHRAAELQSLAYHRLVAERLNEQVVEEARRKLERWIREGRVDPRWAARWQRLLAGSLDEIAETLSSDSQRARELRQTSPFAGVLTEQERRRLVAAVEERAKT